MSKRDWIVDAAPWVIVALGLLIIALFSFVLVYSKGYQRADKEHEADYAAHYAAQRDYEECLAKPTVKEAVSCAKDADEAYRENTRAEQDLDAQREMADWAEGMLWSTSLIGILSVVVTGVGIFFVRATLIANTAAVDQARIANRQAARANMDARISSMKANRIASNAVNAQREIGQAQVRAYLSPSVEKFFGQDGHANPLRIRMTIKNTGQSPALRVSHATAFLVISVQLHESHDFIDHFKFDNNFFTLGAGDVSRGDMHWITEQELAGIVAGDLFCYIAAFARYQDVFSNETWHITRHAYMLRPDPMSVQGPGLEPFGWGGVINNQQT